MGGGLSKLVGGKRPKIGATEVEIPAKHHSSVFSMSGDVDSFLNI